MNEGMTERFDRDDPSAWGTAVARIKERPGVFVVAVVVTALVLLLAGVVVALGATAERTLKQFAESTGVLIVLKPGATSEQVDAVRQAVAAVSGSRSVEVVRQNAGAKRSVELENTQIPVVVRASAAWTGTAVETWADGARRVATSMDVVESVRVDADWVKTIDRWSAQWTRAKTGAGVAMAVFLGILIGGTWFLASRTWQVRAGLAGTYFGSLGWLCALLICAALGWISFRLGSVTWPELDQDMQYNLLFLLGFTGVATLVGAKAADATQ